MTTLFNESQWSASPVALWTIQYEHKRNGADMLYRFYWKVWLKNSWSWFYDGLQLQLFVNGMQHNVTVKGYDASASGWSYEGTTDWYTVTNKTSGTIPFYAKLYDTNAYTVKVTSASYSLTVSGATSAIGAIQTFDVDNGVTISLTKYDSSFVDTLVVSYGGTTIKTVTDITNGTKVSFANELATIYNLMKNVKSGTFTFAVTTKSGSTTIGTNKATATGTITNANPTFDSTQVDYADTSGWVTRITQNNKHIVQNQSYPCAVFTAAEGNKGASIVEYILTMHGVKRTVPEPMEVTFGTINSSKDVVLSVTAKDSRGNTTTVNKNVTVLPWSPPVFSATVERLNNYEDDTYITVDASVSSIDNKNTMTITYKQKQSDGSYGSATTISNKTQHTTQCDKNYTHIISITVKDAFASTTKEFPVAKGKFPLFIDTDMNAVGINEFPKEGEALHVAGGVAMFEKGVGICGVPMVDFIVEQGATDIWTYRKWNSGIAECWGTKTVENAEFSHQYGSMYYCSCGKLQYPLGFFETPIVILNHESTGGRVASLSVDISDGHAGETGTIYAYSPLNQNATIHVCIYAFGKWK